MSIRIRSGRPQFFVETDRIDHQRVALPASDGMAQESRPHIIAAGMRATIHINDPPGVRPGDVEDEDTLEFGHVHDLKAGCIEKRWSTGSLASNQRGVLCVCRLAVIVDGPRPWLEGHIVCTRKTTKAGADFPISFFAGHGA
ncbi:MAG: hypothetical protein DMG12_22525 [Acidobacteria bacterium]|nr:MAG: hypothetical protein DMG12_22525 [Acidobacteriota bacterium]